MNFAADIAPKSPADNKTQLQDQRRYLHTLTIVLYVYVLSVTKVHQGESAPSGDEARGGN